MLSTHSLARAEHTVKLYGYYLSSSWIVEKLEIYKESGITAILFLMKLPSMFIMIVLGTVPLPTRTASVGDWVSASQVYP